MTWAPARFASWIAKDPDPPPAPLTSTRSPARTRAIPCSYLALVPVGLTLAAIDADVHRLPNALTLPLIPVELVLLAGASAATGDWDALRRSGLAALLVGGGFLVLAFVLYGRSIGMGDAKLVVSLAAALGWLSWWHVLLGLWIGFVIGGVVALALLLAKRVTKGTHLAFGPSLVAGALLAVTLA